jgi:tryptophan synthase alpha chain
VSARRIAAAFARAREQKRKALVIYLTAGDPDADTSRRLLLAAARAGADILEVGVPWSDPSADGPVIEAAAHRAVQKGGGLSQSLHICREVRQDNPDVALVLFGYANPIFVRGPRAFAEGAAQAGADGVLCVDWPPDEAAELTSELRARGLDFVPLLAPTSGEARIRRIAPEASGFLYYVSLTGITGHNLVDLSGAQAQVAAIRAVIKSSSAPDLPIAVGFGIKNADDVRKVAAFADGVVVGSAAVATVDAARIAGRDPVPDLEAFVRSLRAALDGSAK